MEGAKTIANEKERRIRELESQMDAKKMTIREIDGQIKECEKVRRKLQNTIQVTI